MPWIVGAGMGFLRVKPVGAVIGGALQHVLTKKLQSKIRKSLPGLNDQGIFVTCIAVVMTKISMIRACGFTLPRIMDIFVITTAIQVTKIPWSLSPGRDLRILLWSFLVRTCCKAPPITAPIGPPRKNPIPAPTIQDIWHYLFQRNKNLKEISLKLPQRNFHVIPQKKRE
jgi:hypothetical protein